MDEKNEDFDAKITVFKWRKLTIGVRQIYNWRSLAYVCILFIYLFIFMPYVSMHYKKVVSDGLIFIYKISISSRNMSFMAKNFPLFHFFV